jgi:hypothetical protein
MFLSQAVQFSALLSHFIIELKKMRGLKSRWYINKVGELCAVYDSDVEDETRS